MSKFSEEFRKNYGVSISVSQDEIFEDERRYAMGLTRIDCHGVTAVTCLNSCDVPNQTNLKLPVCLWAKC